MKIGLLKLLVFVMLFSSFGFIEAVKIASKTFIEKGALTKITEMSGHGQFRKARDQCIASPKAQPAKILCIFSTAEALARKKKRLLSQK